MRVIPPTETSRFVSESAAMMAAVDDDAAAQLFHGELEIIRREPSDRGGYTIFGREHFNYDELEKEVPVQIYVMYPGFIERAAARLRNREPRAKINIFVPSIELA